VACDVCRDGYEFYLHHQQRAIELAKDFDAHAVLLRCESCNALWNVYPEDRTPLEELSEDEARQRFPGAL